MECSEPAAECDVMLAVPGLERSMETEAASPAFQENVMGMGPLVTCQLHELMETLNQSVRSIQRSVDSQTTTVLNVQTCIKSQTAMLLELQGSIQAMSAVRSQSLKSLLVQSQPLNSVNFEIAGSSKRPSCSNQECSDSLGGSADKNHRRPQAPVLSQSLEEFREKHGRPPNVQDMEEIKAVSLRRGKQL
eukprot:Skav209169  [mRNA]  locus=scaffold1137:387904:388473:- [translate_table: standard]